MKHFLFLLVLFSMAGTLCAENNDGTKTSVKNVSGKITATNGEEIPGARITIKETNETFFADLDGNFRLQLKTDKLYSITIQSIGYAPLEIKSTELHMMSEVSLKELQ